MSSFSAFSAPSSLTSPADFPSIDPLSSKQKLPVLRSTLPVLSEAETLAAIPVLSRDIRFTQVERRFADPELTNQKICLVSFIPSKTAVPDKDGFYGMMKVRGVFATDREANEHAEYLIRNVDSLHEIFHAYVGRPFPITVKSGYEEEVKNIDIRKKTVELISEDILNKKKKEQDEMEEIQKREKTLLEESKRNASNTAIDPFEQYITEQVKRAQLLWTYSETSKKMKQMKTSFQQCCDTLSQLDNDHPEYITQYRKKYMEARKEAGLPDDDESFLKYLGLDMLPAEFDDITEIPSFPRSSPSEKKEEKDGDSSTTSASSSASANSPPRKEEESSEEDNIPSLYPEGCVIR